MKHKWLPKEERKTMLFLSDDMRIPSGIGTMTREIIEGTCHRYNWVQLGAAITHPDYGSVIDVSEDVTTRTGVDDPSVIIYPYSEEGISGSTPKRTKPPFSDSFEATLHALWNSLFLEM